MTGCRRRIRFLAALVLIVSLLSPGFPVFAEDAPDSPVAAPQVELPPEEHEAEEVSARPASLIPPGRGEDEEGGVQLLTGRRVYDYDAGALIVADVGGDLSQLDLPQELACYVEGRAAWNIYWCPVQWRYDDVDHTTPGRVSIPGTLLPGEGYALAPDFSEEVFYTAVLLCADGMQAETLARVEFNLNRQGYLAALDAAEPEELLPTAAWCYTALNESYLARVRWDSSGVDTSKSGAYPVSGQLQLPVCLAPPEGETGEYSSCVYVIDPDRIDLAAVVKDTDAELCVEWLYRVPVPADMVVEYAVGTPDGPWISNADHPYQGWYGEFRYGRYNAISLTIEKDELSPATDYYFRIRYGDATSNLLHVNPGGEGPKEPENLIVLEGVNTMFYELKLLPTGTDPAAFDLPKTLCCTHTYNRFSVECPVTWETADLDTAEPGWLYVKGEITPPQGYRVEDGFAAYHPVMLTQEGMARETLGEVFINERSFLAGRGTQLPDPLTLQDVRGLSLQGEIEYVTQNGLHGAAPVTWDLGSVDTSVAGRYPIRGTMELPVCFALPETVNLSASSIQVMESDRIDLSGFQMDNSMNRVGTCHWLFPAEEMEAVTLEYAVGDGDWQQATAELSGGELWANEVPCRYGSNYLTIQFSALEDGEYYFRLTYQGEPSNILHITVDHGAAEQWDIGGDRGGADQGSQMPPDLEQPAPGPGDGDDGGTWDGQTGSGNPQKPPETKPDAAPGEEDGIPPRGQPDGQTAEPPPDAQPPAPDEREAGPASGDGPPPPQPDKAAGTIPQTLAQAPGTAPPRQGGDLAQDDGMTEYSTADTLSISGLRLAELLAVSGDTVLFEKQGVSVELPAEFLAGLSVTAQSRFTVRIEAGEHAFTLEILLDEVPLSALPPTVACLPFQPGAAMDVDNLACFDAQGQEVSAAVYDAARQLARVEIQATGSYTVAEHRAAAVPVSAKTEPGNPADGPTDGAGGGPAVWLPFSALGIAALCAVFLVLRRSKAGGNE